MAESHLTTLLTTKFHIHPVRPRSVQRPILIDVLNSGLDRKLTLISTPAGFGKTALISEWLEDLRTHAVRDAQEEYRAAWLSLDDGDNDFVVFFSYVIGALQSINIEHDAQYPFGQMTMELLQLPQRPAAEEVLAGLLNQLNSLPVRLILVLDDYHVIDDTAIHDAMAFLIDHVPPNLHVVISTRDDPPLRLARLRARGEMTELRAAELRFSVAEVGDFLNRTMELNLSPGHIQALEARTEGWIAGLQLAAVSLQGCKDIENHIASFTGSHRHVVDYLLQEVLSRQSDDLRMFLLQTSILGRLSGSLCNAITGRGDGQAILESLERANLFLVPLDDQRQWYRYHRLFADLLRQRLYATAGDQIYELHRRACTWYSDNGFIDEAVEHALQGEDFERAAQLIEDRIERVWERGDMRYWHLVNRLPDEILNTRPSLCILRAYVLCTSGGSPEMVQRSLDIAERAIDEEQVPALRGRLSSVRAFIASLRGNLEGIIRHADEALRTLSKDDVMWRCLASLVSGDVYGYKGDMTAAFKARSEAADACRAAGSSYHTMGANLKVAITTRELGLLKKTEEICRQQIEFAGRTGLSESILAGWSMAVLGESLAEMNQLEQGLELTTTGVSIAENGYNLAISGWATLCYIRVLITNGSLMAAKEIIERASTVTGKSAPSPWIKSQMENWRTKMLIADGKSKAAYRLLVERDLVANDQFNPPAVVDFFSMDDYLTVARVLLAESRLDESAGLLQVLFAYAERGKRITRMIEILLLQALVHQAAERTEQALPTLQQALALAQPEGFNRIFVDEGSQLARLLIEAASRGIAEEYVGSLLASFQVAKAEKTPDPSSDTPGSVLLEPLSERELEVLRLIGDGLSNQDVGAKMFISAHTVKAHTRNIYAKIDAHTRMEAVAKARAFGLLSS